MESLIIAYESQYGSSQIVDGVLTGEDGQAVNDFNFIDRFGEKLGITAKVFMKDGDDFIRIITNIKKDDGSMAVGTYLGEKSAAYSPIMEKTRFLGEATILGKHYLTSYDPLLDKDGNLIGILYVGIPDGDINQLANDFSRDFIMIFVCIYSLLVLISLLVVTIISRRIAKPIIHSVELTKKISKGDLTIMVPARYLNKKDETGELARAVRDLGNQMSSEIKRILEFSEEISDFTG